MAWRKKDQKPSRRVDSVNQNVPTFSYHNGRSTQENDLGKRATRFWLEKFGLIILAVVIVFCLFSILYLSSSSDVILDANSGGPTFSGYQSAVQATANKLIASSVLNRNKITFDSSKIAATLEADYPMFSTISITLPLIDHHPVIYLAPAEPAVLLTASNGQYLLNENGQVTLQVTQLSRYSYTKLPQLNYTNGTVALGEKELTTQEVQFIQTVIYELGSKGFKVSSSSLPQDSSELNVSISGLNYYLKFNLQSNDPRQQAGSFLATQHYLQSQNITPSQYVDVRTDGRVYYQ